MSELGKERQEQGNHRSGKSQNLVLEFWSGKLLRRLGGANGNGPRNAQTSC